MRRYFCVVLLSLAMSLMSYAQQSDIAIAVAMPAANSLDNSAMVSLKNKVQMLASSAGVAGTEFGALAVVPEVNTTNSQTIEGGMRRVMSADVTTTLTVKNLITGVVFGTIQVNSTGEGYSETEAMRSAINKLDLTPPRYAQFISDAKDKIVTYYQANTSALITKAKTLASQQRFGEALALLYTYPEALSGYASVAKTMSDIYKQCQDQQCSQILLAARAAYARQDYEEAAIIASEIDATSSCASEAKTLLDAIKQSNEKLYQDALSLTREQMKSSERIQTAKINAIKEIATSYFNNRTDIIFL